jgi:hypothetical protein
LIKKTQRTFLKICMKLDAELRLNGVSKETNSWALNS